MVDLTDGHRLGDESLEAVTEAMVAVPAQAPRRSTPTPPTRVAKRTIGAPFSVTLERGDERLLIRPAGELDISTAAELASVIRNDCSGQPNVVIDLGGLTFMDCKGLRVLLYAQARAKRERSRFTLIECPAVIQRILRLTGVEGRLLVDDQPSAGRYAAGVSAPR